MFQIHPQKKDQLTKRTKSRRQIKLKTLLLISFFVYLTLVIYVTLFAWNYGASLGPVGPGGRNYNFIPFRSIYRIAVYSPTIIDPLKILVGNVILFMPFGFLAPIALKKLRKSIFSTTVLAMFFSIAIESSQFLFTYRVSNIDDVILNTLGAFIGAILVKLCFWINSKIIYFQT
ncbi:VanZ family protein [Anaerobacillus alkaliphilus]|uniref:VanZ family protein n=1 Tax=Anaerobacillus alkaliphilus TaxID=1548597 RepID=UPI001F503732|nr:VanZ family protein [Anaerobacillus alkaliphilus]